MGSREQHALGSQRTKVGRLSGDDAPVIGAEVEPTDVAPMMTTLSGFFPPPELALQNWLMTPGTGLRIRRQPSLSPPRRRSKSLRRR